MKPGTVELEIERIVAGGFGLARSADGAVLVRGALPGERVRARPVRRGGVLRAFAMEIVDPHPSRTGVALPPGADLPLHYAAQLPVKHGLVVEALGRIAKLDALVEPVRPSPRALGYRTAAQYAVPPQGGLAARALDSDRLVGLDDDPLIAEPLARAFASCVAAKLHGIEEVVLRGSLHQDTAVVGLIGARASRLDRIARGLTDSGVAGVVWAEPDARGRFRGKARTLEGRSELLEDFGGVRATVTVGSFAQVNPLAAGELYREAAMLAGTGERALDLYAGSGILGLHLAPRFREVIAIDISPEAIRRGEGDARAAHASNISFHRGDARTAKRFMPAEVVVLDPPRAGLAPDVVGALGEHKPLRIVYVSCDPTTWARDVGTLCDGGYRLSVVRPYDFYPYTHHVEVLSLLER